MLNDFETLVADRLLGLGDQLLEDALQDAENEESLFPPDLQETKEIEAEWKRYRALFVKSPEMLALLRRVVQSDMAQREEDEGNVSPLLTEIRNLIKELKIDAVD